MTSAHAQGYPGYPGTDPTPTPTPSGGYPGYPGTNPTPTPTPSGGYPGYPGTDPTPTPTPTGGYPGYPGTDPTPTPTPSGGYPGGGGYPGSVNRGHWVVTCAFVGYDQHDDQARVAWDNSGYPYKGSNGTYTATTSGTATATCTWTHETGQDDTSDPAPATLYVQESASAGAYGDYTTYDNQGQATQHTATLAVDNGSGDPITMLAYEGVPNAEQDMVGTHYKAIDNSSHADVIVLPSHSLSASASWSYDSTESGNVHTAVYYGATPITLSILWNGQDVTDKTQNVKVGQRIGLSGSVTGVDGLTFTNPHWVIPGIRVHDWTYSNAGSLEWPIGDSQLNSSSISYGWVDGGNARQVVFTATVAGMSCQATTKFNVERPSYTFSVTPTGTIAFDPDGSGGARVHYGDASGTPGVTFGTDPAAPSPNYNLKIAQLLSTQRSITSGNTVRSWTPTSGLDAFPSVANDSPDDAVNASDSRISINDSFQDWLMYRPSESDIFVPLSVLSWGWSAAATRQGTTWASSDLGTTTTTPTTATNATDTTAYPQWNQKASSPEGHYQ